MNRKRHQKALDSTTESGKPEVFVLPPNLLQKLGIHLGSIKSSQECPANIILNRGTEDIDEQVRKDFHGIQKFDECNNADESSILETANLMKKSVFLSPTFIPTVSNIIPGEVEIASTLKESEYSNFVADLENSNNMLSSEYSNMHKNVNGDGIFDTKINIENNKQPCSFAVSHEFNLISDQVNGEPPLNSTVPAAVREPHNLAIAIGIVNTNEGISGMDDHPDEAYLSDCSNSNMGSSIHTETVLQLPNIIKDKEKQKSSKKINIISQEIIAPFQMKEIRTIHLPNHALTPVAVNTIISKKKKNNSSHYSENVDKCIQETKSGDNVLQSKNTPDVLSIENKVLNEITEKTLPIESYKNREISASTLHKENTLTKTLMSEKSGENNTKPIIIDENVITTKNIYKIYNEQNSNNITFSACKKQLLNSENVCERFVTVSNNEGTEISGTELNCKLDNSKLPLPKKSTISDDEFGKKYNIINECKTVKHNGFVIDHCAIANQKAIVEENCVEYVEERKNSEKNINDDSVSKNNQHLEILNTTYVSDNSAISINEIKNIATQINSFTEGKNDLNRRNVIDKKETMESKVNVVKSKLCIQGVEKPGGVHRDEEIKNETKIVKTYKRFIIKQKPNLAEAITYKPNYEALNISSDMYDIKINDLTCCTSSKIQEFCICEDFGRLAYYDNDSIYEHLHFWKHQSIDCNSDTIYSIYDNDNVSSYNGNDETTVNSVNNHDNDIESTDHYICWFELECKNETYNNLVFNNHILDSTLDAGVSEFNKSQSNSTNNVVNAANTTAESIYAILPETSSPDEMRIIKGNIADDCRGSFDKTNELDDAKSAVKSVKHTIVDENKVFPNIIEDVNTLPKKTTATRCDKTNEEVSVNTQTSGSEQVIDKRNDNEEVNIIEITTPNNTTPETQKGKKRRKSSIVTKSSADYSDEPQSKKSIKCGVCDLLLSAVDWEDHATKVHSHIAWKAGKTIESSDSSYTNNTDTSFSSSKDSLTKCGVCKLDVEASLWIDHISREHNYLAWKENEAALELDDEELVRQHLQKIVKKHGGLTCSKCGLFRKYVKSYFVHIKKCNGNYKHCINNSTDHVEKNTAKRKIQGEKDNPSSADKKMKCGVCEAEVEDAIWIDHIAKEHNYLAWESGETPLDLQDEALVWQHLNKIAKQHGGLICSKCGINRKYVKAYLHHVKNCDESMVSEFNETNTLDTSMLDIDEDIIDGVVKCGVCQKLVEASGWIGHIQIAHNYIAWIDGKTPIDVNDSNRVYEHLNAILRKVGGLTCMKCGIVRKYLKSYLNHIEICDGTGFTCEDLSLSGSVNKDEYKCAICFKKGKRNQWKEHAMKKHYNIAWIVGEIPIDIRNPYAVEKVLKEYNKKFKKMVCRICGTSRASCVGFYAHILMCGKTEEEQESLKNMCDICNNKYLCIYKNQHIAMHKEQDYKKERKLKAEEKEKEIENAEANEIPTGRRKAAEKARNVIEKYNVNVNECGQTCSSCGLKLENDKSLDTHECTEIKQGYSSESDVSVKLEQCSDDDSPETDIDSELSDEDEQEQRKTQRVKESSTSTPRISRMPGLPAWPVKNINSYIQRSYEDFINLHFTSERLFTRWSRCEYEAVPEDQMERYLPPLNESCKVKFLEDNWTTYTTFEAKKGKDLSIFVGSSIQCMSWVPPHARDRRGGCGSYLAVVAHPTVDTPRYDTHQIIRKPGMLQIWDFGNFTQTLPKLALGLAHDYGTVWGMAWCPSGARDAVGPLQAGGSENTLRLGLVAVACSSGSAYIFSVPYPSTITENEKVVYKLKPVAELRVSMSTEGMLCQATSICWSPQKDHSIVIVGYSDGTTAFYDLNSDSPLLKTTENNVTILYPYHDERPQNICITGVDMYPGGGGERGVVCTASFTGSAVAAGGAGPAGAGAGAGAGAAVMRSHLPATGLAFMPHWPSVLLSGDDSIVNKTVNETEWCGGGRRVGGAGAWGACARCGRLAAASPPLLRLLRAHPADPDPHKQVVAVIQMAPLGEKRKRKQINDELAMKLEPLTYDDAVNKYGIEFCMVPTKSAGKKARSMQTDLRPERYPLSDVTALAFCSSPRHHEKLAVATHAGVIFFITV